MFNGYLLHDFSECLLVQAMQIRLRPSTYVFSVLRAGVFHGMMVAVVRFTRERRNVTWAANIVHTPLSGGITNG